MTTQERLMEVRRLVQLAWSRCEMTDQGSARMLAEADALLCEQQQVNETGEQRAFASVHSPSMEVCA